MGKSGRYLYAVTRGVDPEALSGVAGLGGGTLDVLEHDGLSAVLSTVPLDEYGEEALRANLEQLEWLEVTARTHDAVIKAVSDLGPVAPMRLATIFLDDDSVHRRLAEWYHALELALDRVQGRQEWSVKVLSPTVASDVVAAAQERPSSGADYLRQKRAAVDQRAAHASEAQQRAETIHAALAQRAVAVRLLSPQDPRLTGHQGTMVLNAAYLVDADEGAAFVADVDAFRTTDSQLVVDVRGPWPPYSFAMLEQQ